MKILLVAVGDKMPSWVVQGFDDFVKRLPADNAVILKQIPAAKRGKRPDIQRIKQDEAQRMLAVVPRGAIVIALDEHGKQWDSKQLATNMLQWRQSGQDVALLIGGPDGLGQACRERATQVWSLSALTLPHAMVRVIVIEQLYRAWSLLNNHPYHRV